MYQISDNLRQTGPVAIPSQNASSFEEVFLVWLFMMFSSAPVTMMAKLSISPPGGLGALWAGVGLACLILAMLQPIRTLKIAIIGFPFVLAGLWSCLSYLWSSSPPETLRAGIYFLLSHIAAFAIAARYSWRQIIEAAAICMTILLGLSVLLAIGIPSLGQMQEEQPGTWSGLWPHKQTLGLNSVVGIIAGATLVIMHRGRTYWWFGLLISLVAMLGSTGKTPILMCVAGLGFMIWIAIIHRGAITGIAVTFGGACLLSLVLLSGSISEELILKLLGRGSDLTGRTQIWEGVHYVAEMRPMTGWGFDAVWGRKDELTAPFQWIFQIADFEPANAHSSWLDAFLQLGIPGVVLLCLCMVWAWGAVIIRMPFKGIGVIFAAGILASSMMASFTESNLLNYFELNWLLLVICTVKLAASSRRSA